MSKAPLCRREGGNPLRLAAFWRRRGADTISVPHPRSDVICLHALMGEVARESRQRGYRREVYG